MGPCFVGASARQSVPHPFTGVRSHVLQPQQQCVQFTVSHRTNSRKHTYVLQLSDLQPRELIKYIILIRVPAATQDSSVSSGHGAVGHSPAVVQAARESSSPVEHCRDNRKTHSRGEVHYYVCIYRIINLYLLFRAWFCQRCSFLWTYSSLKFVLKCQWKHRLTCGKTLFEGDLSNGWITIRCCLFSGSLLLFLPGFPLRAEDK